MRNIFHRFIVDESGTGIVESGVVILVIAVVLMGAMTRPGPDHTHLQSPVASAQCQAVAQVSARNVTVCRKSDKRLADRSTRR